MILIRVYGGLGNQLFIYSYGFWLSKKLNKKLSFDLESGFYEDHLYKRNNNLKYFNLNISHKRNILTNSNFFGKLLRFLIRNFFKTNSIFKIYCISDDNLELFSLKQLSSANFIYVEGYFNTFKYVNEIKNQLLLNFFNDNEILKRIKIENQKIFDFEREIVAVHYRSYNDIPFKDKSNNQTVGEDYYRISISYVKNKIKDPLFLIFTDDSELARKIFVGKEYYFVPNSFTELPSQIFDFNLMLLCNHYIIANSTFSWWPAFLKTNTNNIIIRPSDLYYHQNKNFYLKSWIEI